MKLYNPSNGRILTQKESRRQQIITSERHNLLERLVHLRPGESTRVVLDYQRAALSARMAEVYAHFRFEYSTIQDGATLIVTRTK